MSLWRLDNGDMILILSHDSRLPERLSMDITSLSDCIEDVVAVEHGDPFSKLSSDAFCAILFVLIDF